MELFGKIADLCQALVVLLLVFQVSALLRSVDRLRERASSWRTASMTSGAAIAADSAVLTILARAFAAARRDCAICR